MGKFVIESVNNTNTTTNSNNNAALGKLFKLAFSSGYHITKDKLTNWRLTYE